MEYVQANKKYDDASWHYGGEFPSDLPQSAGATHISMFVAWAMLNGLAGKIFTDEHPQELEELRNRTVTPGKWFLSHCGEKFVDLYLNEIGNGFATAYYADDEGMQEYIDDYYDIFPDSETIYHVPDNWESFDRLGPVIQERFITWQELVSPGNNEARASKPWWQFWK